MVNVDALADDVGNGHTWVERSIRILEDICTVFEATLFRLMHGHRFPCRAPVRRSCHTGRCRYGRTSSFHIRTRQPFQVSHPCKFRRRHHPRSFKVALVSDLENLFFQSRENGKKHFLFRYFPLQFSSFQIWHFYFWCHRVMEPAGSLMLAAEFRYLRHLFLTDRHTVAAPRAERTSDRRV